MAFFTLRNVFFIVGSLFLFLRLFGVKVGRLPGDLEVGDGPILGPNRTGGLLLVEIVDVPGEFRIGRRKDPVRTLKSGAKIGLPVPGLRPQKDGRREFAERRALDEVSTQFSGGDLVPGSVDFGLVSVDEADPAPRMQAWTGDD